MSKESGVYKWGFEIPKSSVARPALPSSSPRNLQWSCSWTIAANCGGRRKPGDAATDQICSVSQSDAGRRAPGGGPATPRGIACRGVWFGWALGGGGGPGEFKRGASCMVLGKRMHWAWSQAGIACGCVRHRASRGVGLFCGGRVCRLQALGCDGPPYQWRKHLIKIMFSIASPAPSHFAWV